MELPSEPVDFLIVGGGSAGCALACRLSEDPATRVVLAEAGRDVTPADIPAVLASPYPGRTYFQSEWLWGSLQASRGDSGTNQPTEPWFYEQARLLGGGSPPNTSAVVEDAIRNATMVVIPARPGVFDVNAVQETILTCRAARKPYAVVLNGAPARRDDAESPIVAIAREALAKFRAPVWGGQITNRADLLMALGHGEGAREYYAEGRAAAEIGRLWAAIERSVKAIRGTASASGTMHKQAA